ncbi:unnamed protein product, partial [Rotaria sp. Silwood2]
MSSQNDTLKVRKSQNEVTNEYAKPLLAMNAKYPSNNKTVPFQRTTFNEKNTDRSFPTTNYYKQTTAEIGNIQQLESMKCYNCGTWGHVARNCRTGNTNNYWRGEGHSYSKKRQKSVGSTGHRRALLEDPVQVFTQAHAVKFPIYNPLTVFGRIAGLSTRLLIDSGASLTLINEELFVKLPYYFRRRARNPPAWLILQLADKSQLKVKCV